MSRICRSTDLSRPKRPWNPVPVVLTAVLALGACGTAPEEGVPPTSPERAPEKPSIGHVERLRAGLDRIVAQDAKLEILADGLGRAEGPVWIPDGGYLLFSDVSRNAVYKWQEGTDPALWLEPSGYTGSRPRGGESGSTCLLLDSGGALVLCQNGDRRVARLEAPLNAPEPRFAALASSYQGKKLNSPNDAVFDGGGNLYFTDPPYGFEGGPESPDRELDFQGVYRLRPDGKVSLLVKDLTRPDGIALSPDERVLYVTNSDPEHAVLMAYDAFPDGKLSSGRVFFDTTEWVGERPGLPGGLAVDREGNLFVSGPGGILVISPFGMHLGTLHTTQPTADCTFGGDGSWLYITAESYLLRIRLDTRGFGF